MSCILEGPLLYSIELSVESLSILDIFLTGGSSDHLRLTSYQTNKNKISSWWFEWLLDFSQVLKSRKVKSTVKFDSFVRELIKKRLYKNVKHCFRKFKFSTEITDTLFCGKFDDVF